MAIGLKMKNGLSFADSIKPGELVFGSAWSSDSADCKLFFIENDGHVLVYDAANLAKRISPQGKKLV